MKLPDLGISENRSSRWQRVADAPIATQRVAIRKVAAIASLSPWVDRLLPELLRRGLV